jgi:hypothetical protein
MISALPCLSSYYSLQRLLADWPTLLVVTCLSDSDLAVLFASVCSRCYSDDGHATTTAATSTVQYDNDGDGATTLFQKKYSYRCIRILREKCKILWSSIINHQPSAISHYPSAITHQSSVITHHQSSAIVRRSGEWRGREVELSQIGQDLISVTHEHCLPLAVCVRERCQMG